MRKIIFFGTQDWSAKLLEHLIQDAFFEVALVVTQPDQTVGRKKILSPPPVKSVAQEAEIPVLQPNRLRDPKFLAQLAAVGANFAVVIAYGRLLPPELIALFPRGIINVHPSLLPLWRGPSPVQAALAHGDAVSGVTIMKIDAQMDHGPLLSQKEIPLSKAETFGSFMEKVVDVSEPLLVETLKKFVQGMIAPLEQSHEKATVCRLLTRDDGHIDWQQPVEQIERMVRAYHPWPGTWTMFKHHQKNIRIKILSGVVFSFSSAHPPGTLFEHEGHLLVATSDQAFEIISLQPEGKEPMLGSAFLSGYQELLGSTLT